MAAIEQEVLPFHLLDLCLTVVPLLSSTGISIIRVEYVASGMYAILSMKNLKTVLVLGFKLNDGKLFAGQISRRVFSLGSWEMLKTNVSCKLHTKHNT